MSGYKSAMRQCLHEFTDSEAVNMLQCRAKPEDTRTLFEIRDFMCLHANKVTRDMFYCKLSGNVAAVADAEHYLDAKSLATSPTSNSEVDQMYMLKSLACTHVLVVSIASTWCVFIIVMNLRSSMPTMV